MGYFMAIILLSNISLSSGVVLDEPQPSYHIRCKRLYDLSILVLV